MAPEGRTVHGQLIEPIVVLPEVALAPGTDQNRAVFRGKWSPVHVGTGPCAEACKTALVETRHVRRALGKDRDRV